MCHTADAAHWAEEGNSNLEITAISPDRTWSGSAWQEKLLLETATACAKPRSAALVSMHLS